MVMQARKRLSACAAAKAVAPPKEWPMDRARSRSSLPLKLPTGGCLPAAAVGGVSPASRRSRRSSARRISAVRHSSWSVRVSKLAGSSGWRAGVEWYQSHLRG